MTATPSRSPCKSFNKKKAITCYKLRLNLDLRSFTHIELYRILNPLPGEYYVLPIATLQKQSIRHLSYHKSGAFHWREDDGSRVVPVDDEADARRAELLLQAVEHINGRLDGYCIARGLDVSDDALRVMLDILDGYIIPPLKRLPTVEVLRARKNFTIPMVMSPYQIAGQKLFADDERHGRRRVMSSEELRATLKSYAPNAKIVLLEPRPTSYVGYSSQTMERLMHLGRAMIAEKLGKKPKGFWTSSPGHISELND